MGVSRQKEQETPRVRRSGLQTMVLALVAVAWLAEAPVQFDTALYNGQWRSVFALLGWVFVPLPGISINSFQLFTGVLAFFCFGPEARRLHAPELDRAIIVGLLSVLVTLIWGVIKGGSVYFAYYQIWRYLLALLIAYMFMSSVRNERDLYAVGKLVVNVGLIKAGLCIYHYWAHLAAIPDPTREYVTSHDDSMLFVMAMQVSLIWAFLKGGKGVWLRTIVVMGVILYAVVLNDRRIAWVELVLGLPALYVLIGPGRLRSKINRWGAVAAIPLVAYVGIGTVSNHPMFAPVHALASTGSYSDASSLAREEEIRNLLRTLDDHGNPLLGTGWGRPYAMVERAYNNYSAEWILAPYTPHNSLVGLAAFAGLVGLLGMWGVIPIGAWLAAKGFKLANGDKLLQAAAIASIGAMCTYGIHCYGDIGLQSFVGSVLLGVALGVAGRVAVWKADHQEIGIPAWRNRSKRRVQA